MQQDICLYPFSKADSLILSHQEDILSQDEQQKASRFIDEKDRRWYAFCRWQLREILAQRLGCHPREVVFDYSAHGKPSLANIHHSMLQFNLSHTKNRGLIVTHPYLPIGVDIEAATQDDHSGLINRFFHPHEKALFKTLSVSEKAQMFYMWWVIKESLAKAYGGSLYQVLKAVDLSVDFLHAKNPYPTIRKSCFGKKFDIQLLPMVDNHYSAVAICDAETLPKIAVLK